MYNLFQKFIKIDLEVFNLIQQNLKNPFLDILMPIISDVDNWIWVLIPGWILLFILGKRKGRLVCIITIVTILLADNLTSYIIKPYFGRIRPNALLEMASSGGLSRNYSPSFPSNHAVNTFALAMILSWYYPYLFPLWFTTAGIVGFSRIYIGVHYPLDVVAGAAIGILCAIWFIWLGNYISVLIKKRRTLC